MKHKETFLSSEWQQSSDETPGKMETARLFAYGLPWPEVVFDFRTDKGQEGSKDFLQGTKARFLQTDGSSCYVPVFEALELLRVACIRCP